MLSTLLGLVGPDERIVLAEDSAELRPDHPHVVRLETRPANQEGVGRVTLRDLVRQALRMRPDRLVVGEVRGPEVTELIGRKTPTLRCVIDGGQQPRSERHTVWGAGRLRPGLFRQHMGIQCPSHPDVLAAAPPFDQVVIVERHRLGV